MKAVDLTLLDGTKILIIINHIAAIQTYAEHTVITLSGGVYSFEVKETTQEILHASNYYAVTEK